METREVHVDGTTAKAPSPAGTTPRRRARWKLAVGAVVLVGLVVAGAVWWRSASRYVSTDDAYVNGHVTFVAPRVSGQIARVLVDNNNRVKKGDLLVQLDPEPYQTQVDIAQAAVDAAKSDLVVATAQTRAVEGQMRSLRFGLERAIEDVDNQIAVVRSRVATVASKKATLDKARADNQRIQLSLSKGAASPEEVDRYRAAMLVAEAEYEEALQGVYQARASLGLSPKPADGEDLASVPENLSQTFSAVKQAQSMLVQAAAQAGVSDSFNKTPRQLVEDFYKRDPSGDIDTIYDKILREAPAVKQAQSRLAQTERALEQAKLNLRYCDVIAEIDGVVTRRQANPGNNVQAGQSLMAVRSVTDIWVDANFKETQLAKLRIGQSVDLDVDMYGSRERFRGRITGFTMGTGSTLSLLPAENATGNFVKVVQRVPVRIDLMDYDLEKAPLFIGLSVTPRVRVNEPATGPSAGKVLQPYGPVDGRGTP